jgi:glutamate-1-semialdehyde aminotransferase
MTEQITIKGMPWVHSYNMLKNLERAYQVTDYDFINQWFPIFFGTLKPEVKRNIKEAFAKGMIKISQGEEEGDAVLAY